MYRYDPMGSASSGARPGLLPRPRGAAAGFACAAASLPGELLGQLSPTTL